jgi:hypothetical protein
MPKTLNDLGASLEKQLESVRKKASQRAVSAALKMVRELVYATPVDTSKALSNWQVTLGQPAAFSRNAYFEGDRGSTYEKSAATAFIAAQLVLKEKKPGQSIWLTNNVNYIVDLNNGTSAQEPAGFFERAVAVGRKALQNG